MKYNDPFTLYAELSEEEQARIEDEADRENDERRIERIANDDRGGPQDYDAYLDRLADDREAERIERRLRNLRKPLP